MLRRSDIIANASVFSKTWKDASDEEAEAKSFWDVVFQVFGTPRKNVIQAAQKPCVSVETIGT